MTDLTVRGPTADALLLAGWLESRLGHAVRLQHEDAPAIERVAANGADVSGSRAGRSGDSERAPVA